MIDENKKVINPDEYADIVVYLPSGERVCHWSISGYRTDQYGTLSIYAYYANGVGSSGVTHGTQRECLEAFYIKGQWAGVRYISGNPEVF